MKKNPLSADTTALSITAKLKLETQHNHEQIEQISTLQKLFSKDYSLIEYQWHLEKMYGYFTMIETLMSSFLQDESLQCGDLARNKLSWLTQDLLHFGLSEAQILILPQCPTPKELTTLSAALGAFYVVEGSSLGGQVIYKQLNKHFGETIVAKSRFYQGYGAETRSQWQQFCDLLNQHFADKQPAEIAQAVMAAKITFDSLAAWLQA